MTSAALSFTADLKSFTTELKMNTHTQTRMPPKAFCTQAMLAKLLITAAMMEMMMMEGDTTPRVVRMPPRMPRYFLPMKVAVFTAMTPGVHWPMA